MAVSRKETNNGVIRKYFSSHTAYSRESNVFSKLKGSGLGPELLNDFNGFLEYRIDEGETLLDRVEERLYDPESLATVFEEFCDWYNSYRTKTNLILSDVDPEKFIYTKKGLIYTVFENCRPGYAEQDLASFAGHFCRLFSEKNTGGDLSEKDLRRIRALFSAAILLICVCAGHMRWRPDLLEKYLRQELSDLDPQTAELFITYMTCAGAVISIGEGEAAVWASSVVSSMPARYLCTVPESELSFPGFEKIPCSSDASAMYAAAKACTQPWMLFLSGDMTGVNPEVLRKLFVCSKKNVDAVFFNDYWDHVIPILIRTEKVRSLISGDMPDNSICAMLKNEASVRLLVADDLFMEE